MKKALLSLAAVAALATSLAAASITLYQDPETGAIYTKPGEGRIKLGEFVSKDELTKTVKKDVKKELGVKVKSGVPTLKFSGTHYLGYVYTDDRNATDRDSSKFETRRNYFQVKAYWNDTDYMRTTLDTFQDVDGSWLVRLKYAYIYLNLDDYIPFTGVEFGQVHRPWIDWEEHHGWFYRSIAKTFIEEGEGAHLTDSADLGINFKTKMDYFSSEIGVFNGAGYHHAHTSTDMSYEWRLTANILGTGKKHVHPTEDEYFDVSFTGQINNQKRYNWYGLHAVYNQPMFLIAGMYVNYENYDDDKSHNGWTLNGEFRPTDKWALFARYDNFEYNTNELTRNETIAGAAYTYNKNVKFIGNVFYIDDQNADDGGNDVDTMKYMFTTEVHW
ncbi:hypothetical protein [Hydrogenimonas sp.]